MQTLTSALPRLLFYFGLLAQTALFIPSVQAAPGDLDPSFGTGGLVVTDFGSGAWNEIRGIALQPDGKIVAAGSTEDLVNIDTEFALARYNTDGTLDITFGTGGLVITELDPVNNSGDKVLAMALQPDGKIVVAGFTDDPVNGDTEFALARYNADGTLDTTFGTAGLVVTDFGLSLGDNALAMALQPDGKIIAGGTTLDPVNFDTEFALARYNVNGALDTTFGTAGLVITDFDPVNNLFQDVVYDIALQPDGKIVAAGIEENGFIIDSNFGLARYLNGAAPAVADLAVSKTAAPNPVQVGSNLTYTITVTNNGPTDPATGVTLTDTLPAGVAFVSATPSQGTPCTRAGVTVSCNLGNVTVAAPATVSIVVTPTPGRSNL